MRFKRLTTETEVQSLVLPECFSLDLETTGLNPRVAELLTVVIGLNASEAVSIPGHMLPMLTERLLDPSKTLFLQNFKYDFAVLHNYGVDLINTRFLDTMLMHHLIDESKEHGLDAMVKEYYKDNYKELFWAKHKTYEEATPEDRLDYECKDAIYTWRLAQRFRSQLTSKAALVEHVHRLAKSLYLTEVYGVRVDLPLMQKTQVEMRSLIDTYLPALRTEFSEHCENWELKEWVKELDKRKTLKGKQAVPKPTFNFGSNNQIQWLLYDALGMPVLKKTKAKKPATDYETIEKLEQDYPRLKTYKDYIEIKTIFGTFVEGLIERVEDGRIYPSFNVNGTVTGRISHSNPNMGNMPKDGVYRHFFLPDPGCSIVGADFSQLEVVIEAHLTQDKNLRKIILEGASKHDITAQEMSIDRDLAKTMNFAMGYHCGIPKLQKLLKCSYQEAEYQWNRYWEVYSGCRDLKLMTDAEVEAGIPIVNMVGRNRHLVAKFENKWELEAAQRQAYNFKIQGPGADFTNKSFYRASECLRDSGRGRALWSVHDEILLSVIDKYADEEREALVLNMQSITQEYALTLPLKAKGYGPLAFWSKT